MKLYLNALGVANPLGRGKQEVARNLFRGSRDGLVHRADLLMDRPIRVGVVTGTLPAVPEHLARFDCRNNRLALASLIEIESDLKRVADRVGSDRIAVVMGTSTSGIAEGEVAIAHRTASGEWPKDFRASCQEIGNLASFAAAYFGLDGPAYTISTACSSSAKVFASAQRLINAGLCDAAIVGGADTLCRMTLGGFDSLQALAKDYCNPFSRNRDGINIGEGAAAFLLTSEESAVSLLGVGGSHPAGPTPSSDA